MKPLLRLLKPLLGHVALLSVCINLLLLTPAIFMMQVFDRVLASGSQDTLVMLLVGSAIGLGLMFALDQLRTRLQGVAGHLIADALTPVVTAVTVAASARQQGRARSEGLRDVNTLRTLFSAQGLLALLDTPWLAVYVTVIWLVHPYLGMTALGAAVLMLGLAVANDRLTRSDLDALQKAGAGANRYLETSMANAEVIQALGMTDALIDRWRERRATVTDLQAPANARAAFMAAASRASRQGLQILMLAVGAWLVVSGQASAGVTIACTILLGRALAPVEQVVGSWRLLAEGRTALARLAALLDAQAQRPARMELPPPQGALTAQGLAFRVQGNDTPLLFGVSFRLDAGQSLVIVGPSGAGKSTLLRMLAGLWPASAGEVRLDGTELAQWDAAQLGPWIGYVPQDVELFPGTVAQNIARLGPVDSSQVIEAARRANVHEMIQSLPDGYDTHLEPTSGLLSPGQRQRIALARALFGSPRLLLLDEPNSNLDAEGEAALGATLASLRGSVTVVTVTHRTQLIQHMDQMMVLEGGRVSLYGPTGEVLKALNARNAPRTASGKVVSMPVAAAMEKST